MFLGDQLNLRGTIMAGQMVYVEAGSFKVSKIFDSKLKAKVATMMKDATAKAIKEQKTFTTDKKKAAGKEYAIGGTVTDLACDGEGAKATLSISILPVVTDKGGKIVAKLKMTATGKLSGINTKKIEGDIEFLIDSVWRKDFMAKAGKILPTI